MKRKNRKVLLSGGSTLLVSSLVGSSVPGNVNAGGKEILDWITAKFVAFVAYIGSIFNSDNSNAEKNEGIKKTLTEEEIQEQSRMLEEERKKQEVLRMKSLELAGKAANRLKEKLGDKIQLNPDEEDGCYFGKITIFGVGNIDIKVSTKCSVKKIEIKVTDNACLEVVQSNGTEEEKIDKVTNCVVDWCYRVENRMSKILELVKTGRFILEKNLKFGYIILCPKNGVKLSIIDKDGASEQVGAVVYDVVADKLCFYDGPNKSANYSVNEGFFNLRFNSSVKLRWSEKDVLKDLSIFDRFVFQLKSNKNSNNINFKVSDEESVEEGNQDFCENKLGC